MYKRLWVIIIDLILFSFIPINGVIVHAQSNHDEVTPNTVAEQLIIESVRNGEVADLSILPNETDRVISGEFFENLLTEKIVSINNNGIFIKDAIIEGDVTLTNKVLPGIDIRVTDCLFKDTVNLQGSKFESLSFSYCTFSKELKLNKSTIFDSASLEYANFNGYVDFSFINIARNLDLNSSTFNNQQIANFNNIHIGDSAFIDNVVFEGPVDFSHAKFNSTVYFDKTQFHSLSESNFNSIDVDASASFANTIFSGSINFGHARIGANLDFNEAKFNSSDRLLFNSMEISGSILFQNVNFSGPVFFLYTKVGNLMDFSNSQFKSEYLASFGFLNVEHEINFEKAIFNGPANFGYIDSRGPFNFSYVKFSNPSQTVTFTNIRVGGSFFLSNSSTSGGLAINNAIIENSIVGDNIEFLTIDKPISISSSESRTLLFDITALNNTISFTNCTFLSFQIQGPEQDIHFLSLNIANTKVLQNFGIRNLTIRDFVASNFVSLGNTNMRNLDIEGSANLSFANFNNFVFQNVVWPEATGEFDLDGFTYHEIIPGESLNNNNRHELINMINSSNYNVALYRNLENYFNQYGRSDWADEVLVAQKRRERSEILKWYSIKWWWSLFLDIFILYGKSPGRAFLWSGIIIFLGSFIFKKEKMIKVGGGDKLYNPLFYSLDLFIPYIDLGISNKWEPSSKALGATVYKRIHLIIGWIVIPIALLSISGYFK